jgi:hypothetical protein
MKIEIVKDDKGLSIGWDIVPETKEDDNTIATMRDLTFFGIGDTHIKYDGMRLKKDEDGKSLGNIEKLCFKQKKHTRETINNKK